VQNEPNSGRGRKMSGGDAQPTKRRSVRNEPNFARPAGKMRRTNRNVEILVYLGKVVMWAVVRPAREMCKTNPIWTARAWGGRTGVSGQEGPPCRPLTSHFKPQTAHFPTEIVRNEAKLGQDGVCGQRLVQKSILQNKANFGAGPMKDNCRWGNGL
jgi:hypothetical protein